MNKLLLTVFMVLAIIVVACGGGKKTADKAAETQHTMKMESGGTMTADEKLAYYTCPMESHKKVHSAEAGKCPECGMKMVKAVITSEENKEFYGCPMEMHSHVRSDQPGTCDECGMKLKPMRLVKS